MIEMEKTVYICEHCHTEYDTAAEAEVCEKSHRTKLSIIDMIHNVDDNFDGYGFPQRIMVEIDNYSGVLAEYVLNGQGPVEGFEPYHPEEYYEQDWDTDDG